MDTRATTQPGIELEIGELVLHGFPSSMRHAVAESLELELTRLFVERGASVFNRLDTTPSLDLGSFELPASAPASAIGRRIATSLYEGMERCARD